MGHPTKWFGLKTRKSLCNSPQKDETCFREMSFPVFGTSDRMFCTPKPGNICATVPISAKRVFWENVSPFLGHPTKCFGLKTRKYLCNSPQKDETCFLGKCFPEFGTCMRGKLGLGSDVIAKNNMKIKKLKAFEM